MLALGCCGCPCRVLPRARRMSQRAALAEQRVTAHHEPHRAAHVLVVRVFVEAGHAKGGARPLAGKDEAAHGILVIALTPTLTLSLGLGLSLS